ncbi:MAG: DJ-1/PfpI family protein [Verrucomicrobiae bacterium]|nr:DJ-1/PfpI family protein [Verrucomicrobiae bacterium]
MKQESLTVGAVIFPGFEMLDLYGPLEMFGLAGDGFQIRIVSESGEPVESSHGPRAIADDLFSDDRRYDILLVPGGRGTRNEIHNRVILEWLKKRSWDCRFVTSVCTGSVLLAVAGVLEGRKATTNKLAFDWVASFGVNIEWQRKARWVEDGKYFTASGVSAGIDMALALVDHILGPTAAEEAALRAEYQRNTDADRDPFANVP